jgi:hypothetical protein
MKPSPFCRLINYKKYIQKFLQPKKSLIINGMSFYSCQEIINKLNVINTQLEAAYKALTYRYEDAQGSHSVTRSINDLEAAEEKWRNLLEENYPEVLKRPNLYGLVSFEVARR